jgi:hypothetical protein
MSQEMGSRIQFNASLTTGPSPKLHRALKVEIQVVADSGRWYEPN